MKASNILVAVLAGGAMMAGAARGAESTPFAQQPFSANGEAPMISLSDMMAISQMRHIKLWQAGKLENWPLASYEAEKLRESLFRAASFYVNIPVPLVKSADEQLGAVIDAAQKGDPRGFERALGDLTLSCNACHHAAGLDFVRMRMPTSSVFTDQDFAPARPIQPARR